MTDTKNEPGKGKDEAKAGNDPLHEDPAEFGASSDYVQTGTTGRYSGGGPDQSSADEAGRGGMGNNAGSQSDWQGKKADAPEGDSPKPKPKADDGTTAHEGRNDEIVSRSADPGQSSYGGFHNEGTSPTDAGKDNKS